MTIAGYPYLVNDPRALKMAQAIVEGFNRHYSLFRQTTREARTRFEHALWAEQHLAQRNRIEFYDERVRETCALLEAEFAASQLPMDVWQQVKLHVIGLLTSHLQPELAETFFNSVTTKILHRSYFHNHFIFVRPAISTEYIENDEPGAQPTYWAYYPSVHNLPQTWARLMQAYKLQRPFVDLTRDAHRIHEAVIKQMGDFRARPNFQIQALSNLFFRNKGAYVVGKVVNGYRQLPFAFSIFHNRQGQLYVDAILFGMDELASLFSFARSYFQVEMDVPSAYVRFLRSLMPDKPRSEIYTALGLHKQGKALFYRDFLDHLRHSSDSFRISPGIRGMVMIVFDLPSYPYVFKVIKDFFPPQKDTSREQIQSKYRLVKRHDRVGRMADTAEYSEVAFPLDRFEPDLVEEIRQFAPSQLEISDRDGNGEFELILKHVYIERRMVPLNIYLQECFEAGPHDTKARQRLERAVIEYGYAIKELVAANIFPGDMLWKNFGVTRYGRVVFYDYDEIEYITDCHFRRVPAPRTPEEEMSGEVWYRVGPKDIFPETFEPFLLGNPEVREVFMKHHSDLLDVTFWQKHQQRIQAGELHNVLPYDSEKRFSVIYANT